MEAIRAIQTVENGEIHLRLPEQFWGQEVEIIVLPVPQADSRHVTPSKSLRGYLKHYAKPELIPQEHRLRCMPTGRRPYHQQAQRHYLKFNPKLSGHGVHFRFLRQIAVYRA